MLGRTFFDVRQPTKYGTLCGYTGQALRTAVLKREGKLVYVQWWGSVWRGRELSRGKHGEFRHGTGWYGMAGSAQFWSVVFVRGAAGWGMVSLGLARIFISL